MDNMCYIAYLDLMGFSDLIEKYTLDDANYLFQVIEIGLKELKENFKREKLFNLEDVGELNKIKCRIIPFSDTLVLYTTDLTRDSLNRIIFSTFIVANKIFTNYSLVRGVITAGEAALVPYEQDIIVQQLMGKGVVRAARLEKAQKWIGILIDPRILKSNPKNSEYCNIERISDINKKLVIKYKVPLYKNKIFKIRKIDTLVFNWTINLTEPELKGLMERPSEKRGKEKYHNTIKFLKKLEVNGQKCIKIDLKKYYRDNPIEFHKDKSLNLPERILDKIIGIE